MEELVQTETFIDKEVEDEIRNAKAYLLRTSSKAGENL